MLLPVLAVLCILRLGSAETTVTTCDVLVAGGSLASLAAALAAANVSASIRVCLLEATDWLGGQLTSSAVSAVDFGQANRMITTSQPDLVESFVRLLDYTLAQNPGGGRCSVSTVCFPPALAVNGWIADTISSLPNLKVFYNTVVTATSIDALSGEVTAMRATRRTPVSGSGYNNLLSVDLPDWYAEQNTSVFTKEVLAFSNFSVAIEATEFGDVLMASLQPAWVAQGVESPFENSTTLYDRCGQATTIPFYMTYGTTPFPDTAVPPGSDGGVGFSFQNTNFSAIWEYRRSISVAPPAWVARQGDTTNQNWGGGNDLPNAYLLLPTEIAFAQAASGMWAGGINLTALRMGEQRAYGWYVHGWRYGCVYRCDAINSAVTE